MKLLASVYEIVPSEKNILLAPEKFLGSISCEPEKSEISLHLQKVKGYLTLNMPLLLTESQFPYSGLSNLTVLGFAGYFFSLPLFNTDIAAQK